MQRITIDFTSDIPIYRQIVDQILRQIKGGSLAPGERLPTERELASELQIARGTVKRAYKELSDNNLIEVIQGSGSYVFNDRQTTSMENRKTALRLMDGLLEQLDQWELSQREISALFRLALAKRSPAGRVRCAIVDCNPESLALFKRQLRYIPGLAISVLSVETILLEDDPARLLEGFDLVLTTVTHYEQLAGSLKPHNIPLTAVDVSTSRETIVNISTLPRETSLGILCQSNKFANLILEQLELFTGVTRHIPLCFESDPKKALRFMKRFDAVIVSPDLPLLAAGGPLDEYLQGGGRIIPFDYLIDPGSLIHVEYLVDGLLARQGSGT